METAAQALPAREHLKRSVFLVKKSFQLRQIFYTLSLPAIFLNLALALLPVLLYYQTLPAIRIRDFDEFLNFYFRFVLSVMILEVMGFVIAYWFSLRFSHRIAGPLFNLERCMNRFADGALSVNTRFRKHDEFPELADAFNRAVDRHRARWSDLGRTLSELSAGLEGKADAAEVRARLAALAQEIEKSVVPPASEKVEPPPPGPAGN